MRERVREAETVCARDDRCDWQSSGSERRIGRDYQREERHCCHCRRSRCHRRRRRHRRRRPSRMSTLAWRRGSSGGGGRHDIRRKLVACRSSSRTAPPNNGFCFLLSQATRRRNDLRERPIRRFTTTSPIHVKTVIPNRLYYTTIDVLCTRM